MSNSSTEMPKKKRKRRTADVPPFTELDSLTQKLVEVSLRRLCKRAVDDCPPAADDEPGADSKPS